MIWISLLACHPVDQAYVLSLPALELGAQDLDFGPVALDTTASLPLAFSNPADQRRTLSCVTTGPFALESARVGVESLASQVLLLGFAPQGAEPVSGRLRCEYDSGLFFELPISGETLSDGDGDGYEHLRLGGLDCDDGDAQVHPGAEEIWYDGVDQDCEGDADDDQDGDGWGLDRDCDDLEPQIHPGASESWYDGVDQDCSGGSDYDQDGDGYEAEPWGPDCDDSSVRFSPDTEEIWYDGVDLDCSGGSDYDQDADGLDAKPWGVDCDDLDPAVGAC